MHLPAWVLRSSLLGFTIVSTVATSEPPPWTKSSTTPPETITLSASAPVTRHITVEASQKTSVTAFVDLEAPEGTVVTLQTCGQAPDTFTRRGSEWLDTGGIGMGKRQGPFQGCWVEPGSTTDVIFSTPSLTPITLVWRASGYIDGDTTGAVDEDAAFVAVSVTP
jgi:hypothetical protein